MIEAILLSDFLKNLPVATSNSGLSMLCVNSLGDLQKHQTAIPSSNCPLCLDADAAPVGFSKTIPSTVNLPDGANGNGGFIFTMDYDGGAKIQTFFRYSAGAALYLRRRVSGSVNDGWDVWKRLAFQS